MLIDFTVENFRSIKEPVTLSAVAQRGRAGAGGRKGVLSDDEIALPFPVPSRKFDLLPVLGILGPNASGKSNLLNALDALLTFIGGENPAFILTERFTPFLLHAGTATQPTRFILRLACKDTLYEFSLRISKKRIEEESLVCFPSKTRQARLLYRALWNGTADEYEWETPQREGTPRIAVAMRENWSGQKPFLTTLLAKNPPLTAPLSEWLRNRWSGIGLGEHAETDQYLSMSVIEQLKKFRDLVVEFLRNADTGIDDIEFQESEDAEGNPVVDLYAVHFTPEGKIRWLFDEESTGTQGLLTTISKIVWALELGQLALIDELGSTIHRDVTHKMIRLFQNRETNPNGAQLIFATHDTTVLADQLLRRDEVWFTERRGDGSTKLFPATDFHPRTDLDMYRAYTGGRFGAVPLLPRLTDLLPRTESQEEKEPAVAGVAHE